MAMRSFPVEVGNYTNATNEGRNINDKWALLRLHIPLGLVS